MKITLEEINKHSPCYDPIRYLEEGKEYGVIELLKREDVPIADRVWLGCVLLDKKAAIAFGCWCIRNTSIGNGRYVWDLLTDERSRCAIITAEKYVKGEATEEELAVAAWAAAWAAARAAARASATWATARAARDLQLNRLIEIYQEQQQ